MTLNAHRTTPGPANGLRLPLHIKITLLVVALLSVCMGLFCFSSYSIGRRARTQLAETEMRRTASLIASMETQDQSPDWDRIHAYIHNVMSLYSEGNSSDLLELVYIVIKDNAGTPRAFAFHQGLIRKYDIRFTTPSGEPLDEKNYAAGSGVMDLAGVDTPGLTHLTMDITVNGRRHGAIAMGYMVNQFAQRERAVLMSSLAVLCTLLALGMMLAIVLSRQLVRPILAVVRAMDRAAGGDFSARVSAGNRDETRLLVQGFNQMAASLEQSRSELGEKTLALAESELKHRSVVDNANDGICIVQGGALRFVNPQFATMVDEPRDKLVGAPFIHCLHPDERARFSESLDRLINGLARRQLVESALARADGGKVPVEMSINAITWSGAPAGLIFARDITERIRSQAENQALQNQLIQAQKMEAVGTLAGGVAHDFNNLLAVILGMADLALIGRSPSDPEYRRYKKIVDVSHKARELTTRLLTFVRKEKLNIETVHIDAVVRDAVEMLRRTLPRKIRLETRSRDHGLYVSMDANQVQQALLNICLNAVDAMPGGGDLCVSTLRATVDAHHCAARPGLTPGPCCIVEITDTGPGVPEEIRPKIFEPFFTTKSRGKGTGLGLFTTLSIFRNHGGQVEVDDAPGGGALFRIYLPLAGAPCTERALSPDPEAMPRGRSETILVVEDEPDLLQLTRDALESMGYCPLCAGSGRDAIHAFQVNHARIDLVILDMIMPGQDGPDVFLALRGIDPHARIALCSGYSENGEAGELLARGALGFLQKPYNMARLADFVRRMLDAPPTV